MRADLPPVTCRTIDVDGRLVHVRGRHPLDELTAAAVRVLARAAVARYRRAELRRAIDDVAARRWMRRRLARYVGH